MIKKFKLNCSDNNELKNGKITDISHFSESIRSLTKLEELDLSFV